MCVHVYVNSTHTRFSLWSGADVFPLQALAKRGDGATQWWIWGSGVIKHELAIIGLFKGFVLIVCYS